MTETEAFAKASIYIYIKKKKKKKGNFFWWKFLWFNESFNEMIGFGDCVHIHEMLFQIDE